LSERYTISKEKSSASINDFEYSKNFDFNELYEIIKNFEKEHQLNSNHIPLGYLSFWAERKGFTFDIVYLSDNQIIYTFIFQKILGSNKTLMFNFAAEYDWEDLQPSIKEIEIEPVPRLKAYEGIEFYYKVEAKGENVMFDDYTELFDIDKNTGEIRFVPRGDDSGTHNILIKAYNNLGNEDTIVIALEIEKNLEGEL
jgi:hypothetical protein